MPDTFDTITHLINSPPGQLVAGGILAGIVWKFFERLEAVLTDQTKLEIAVWLVGRKKVGPKVEPWPETFAKVFDRVFGSKHFSWKCFRRSCMASGALAVVSSAIMIYNGNVLLFRARTPWLLLSASLLLVMSVVDFLSLLESRHLLRLMVKARSGLSWLIVLLLDCLFTGVLAAYGIAVVSLFLNLGQYWSELSQPATIGNLDLGQTRLHLFYSEFLANISSPKALIESIGLVRGGPFPLDDLRIGFVSAFFTSIWLWLYAGSGFLLKAARRFDIGFDWFNRKFDIEKKPLQSIGLVAGALVAVVYWAAVIVSRVVG